MTFLSILGDTEILCSLELALEGKTGKEIPESSRLEFLEKFSANNFALSDAENNIADLYSRFTFVENTISNSPKVTRAKWKIVRRRYLTQRLICIKLRSTETLQITNQYRDNRLSNAPKSELVSTPPVSLLKLAISRINLEWRNETLQLL